MEPESSDFEQGHVLNGLKSASEVLDDYLDSIYNLSSEVVANLEELRHLDEQCEKLSAICKECQEKYFACIDSDQKDEDGKSSSYWKNMAEKYFEEALQKQDEKIAIADNFYNLLTRHFERLDEELARNNIHIDEVLENEFEPHEPVYCVCKRPEFGHMVQCDHPKCETGWYHWECVGLSQQPSGQWFCPDCEFIQAVEPNPIESIMHAIENFAMYSYPGQPIDDFPLNNTPFNW
ncbi:14101_t:CDS:2 [Acaulospora morrowiae]|uniref:Chromatin modification-related protein n=1 Tax=Acaulospora morrowiae TaxID=94023 RepID=A0A9N8VUF9_9GLOM|nr:14101_t:CDS:2 [Acaulospora morrowiae]